MLHTLPGGLAVVLEVIFPAGRALMQGRTPSSVPVKPCFCCGCSLIVAGAPGAMGYKKAALHIPGGAVGGFKRAACPTLGPAAADISFLLGIRKTVFEK